MQDKGGNFSDLQSLLCATLQCVLRKMQQGDAIQASYHGNHSNHSELHTVYIAYVCAVYALRMCCVCAAYVYVLRMCCVCAAYVLRM